MMFKVVFITSLVVLITGCEMDHMDASSDSDKTFSSNGERIYFTGLDSSGKPIRYSGGGMHGQMHQGRCVDCHGESREGGNRMYPKFWVIAPSLTKHALFDDHQRSDHGDHKAYTRETLKAVISNGINPDGELLDESMPRWSMKDGDMDDLISFLSLE
jgi:cytochrome c2